MARSHGNETRQLCRFIKWLTLLFLVLDFTSISLFQPANITRDACTIKIRSTDPHLRSLSLSTAPAQPIDCSVFSSSFVVLSLSRTLRVFVPLKSYTTSLFNETQRQFAKRLRRSEFSSTPRSQKGRVASLETCLRDYFISSDNFRNYFAIVERIIRYLYRSVGSEKRHVRRKEVAWLISKRKDQCILLHNVGSKEFELASRE